MQHQRIVAETSVGKGLLDRFEAFEIQVLFAFKLVSAVRISNRDSERIDTGFFDELHRFLWMGVMSASRVTASFFSFVELSADQFTEFALDDAIMFVRVIDDLLANFDVFIEWQMRAIDHHRGEPFVDAFLAKLK